MSTPVKLSTPVKGDANPKKSDLPFGLSFSEARVLLIGMACAAENSKPNHELLYQLGGFKNPNSSRVCYNAARRKFEDKFAEFVRDLGIELPADLLKPRKAKPKTPSKKGEATTDDEDASPSKPATKASGSRKTKTSVKKEEVTTDDEDVTPSNPISKGRRRKIDSDSEYEPVAKAARGQNGKQAKIASISNVKSSKSEVVDNIAAEQATDSFVEAEEAALTQLASAPGYGESAFNYPDNEELFAGVEV
ncbi:hypothetical protein N7474_008368 [Penicillium riverlandense]|uniref:uncharacterized protein n=1 Tax=Penicillium riverlandense TaxID=1903569 RepID=UPI002546D8F3|nr:uncharacterized protein N7474_008368 [Penicillium riverlandense]KAJ5812067.1 hypothetical protein N7474_008368 [Penicillium riverlandense]